MLFFHKYGKLRAISCWSVRSVLCLFKQELRELINRLPALAKSTQCVGELESLLNFLRFCARPMTRWPRLSVTQPLVQQPGFPSQSLKERLVEIQWALNDKRTGSSISNVMDEEPETTNCG